MLLSVVIPVYNERATVAELIARVAALDLEKEIIAVDDGSADGTREILACLAATIGSPVRLILHERNAGKGAALRTGFAAARGDIVIVQDADLEYDPAEIPRIIRPIIEGKADVVFGSRFVGSAPHRVLYFWHAVANRFITLCSNALTNLNLTDIEVCYKAFRREVIADMPIRENGFGIEPELTARVARGGWRVFEVGVSYSGRTYEQGKKITWKDGVRALYCIAKYNLFDRG